MYLPERLPDARVLITVKTYPLPSGKYEELVCTAGVLGNGQWIRIYPVPFRRLPLEKQYRKYHWLQLDLVKKENDFRPESYKPALGLQSFPDLTEHIDTSNNWEERKQYVLGNVFESLEELIALAKGPEGRSLATVRPTEIIDLVIEETEREWKPDWQEKLLQYNMFDMNSSGEGIQRQVIRKLPFKYSYKFLTSGDQRPRTIMIEDWEIGALFWNCLERCEGDEEAANTLVRKKYVEEFLSKKDLYFFMGTTLQYHKISQSPFVIIGVFYPPKLKTDLGSDRQSSFLDSV